MSETRPPLRGERILVTGPAGRVAFPLALRLARENEVWGVARFGNAAERERLEAAGVRTRRVDLAAPDWSGLPSEFTLLLHFAAAIGPTLGFDEAIAINALGTGRLMSRFRSARACLVASSRSVYAEPEDPDRLLHESDPLGGDAPTPYSPTYRVSKLAQEAVARFCAEEFGLPTTLARINVVYGDNGGLPAMLLDAMLAGQPVPLAPHGATRPSPIHHEDLLAQLPGLLAGAAVPATIVNWGGDEPVDVRDLCRFMAELVGCEARFAASTQGPGTRPSDPARRLALAGPCRVAWRDGIRRMVEALHPERVARAQAPPLRGST